MVPPARRCPEHCRTVATAEMRRRTDQGVRASMSEGGNRLPRATRNYQRSGLFRGRLGAGVHLALSAEDAAPFLVFGDRHPAFNANSDSRTGLSIAGKQLLQNGHGCSEFVDSNLRRI
jgi:hypothetical protein